MKTFFKKLKWRMAFSDTRNPLDVYLQTGKLYHTCEFVEYEVLHGHLFQKCNWPGCRTYDDPMFDDIKTDLIKDIIHHRRTVKICEEIGGSFRQYIDNAQWMVDRQVKALEEYEQRLRAFKEQDEQRTKDFHRVLQIIK